MSKPTNNKPVSRETVDTMTGHIMRTSRLNEREARKIATESAERVSKKRAEGK